MLSGKVFIWNVLRVVSVLMFAKNLPKNLRIAHIFAIFLLLAICHRGLDSMTVAEHRELNEIYCKSCYRLYIGPDGYGYPPNGPALISYDMEHQDPPPGSEVKWRTPPTRLGKVFWRPKTLPSGQTSIGSRVIGKSNTKIQSHSGVKGQGSGFKGQGSVHASSSRR